METITGRHNALLTHLRKLVSSRAYREEQGEYVGDGVKLLYEALKWGAPVTTVVLSQPVGYAAGRAVCRGNHTRGAARAPDGAALSGARRRAGPRQRGDHPAHGGRV